MCVSFLFWDMLRWLPIGITFIIFHQFPIFPSPKIVCISKINWTSSVVLKCIKKRSVNETFTKWAICSWKAIPITSSQVPRLLCEMRHARALRALLGKDMAREARDQGYRADLRPEWKSNVPSPLVATPAISTRKETCAKFWSSYSLGDDGK